MFLLCYMNYAILHATRSSWSQATPDLEELYGFDTRVIARMNSTFLFFYALGGFFISHLGDVYQKGKFICFMYSMIALVMICLGCFQFIPADKQKPWYFFVIKALNGGFQSCAWSVNFAIMCNWFPKKGRGLVIGIYGTCTSIGDIIGI